MNNEEAVEDLALEGHTDLITGLSISPDGNHLLSNRLVTATALYFPHYSVQLFIAYLSVSSDFSCMSNPHSPNIHNTSL